MLSCSATTTTLIISITGGNLYLERRNGPDHARRRERLGGNAVSLNHWQSVNLPTPDGRVVRVTGTPPRHGTRAEIGARLPGSCWPWQNLRKARSIFLAIRSDSKMSRRSVNASRLRLPSCSWELHGLRQQDQRHSRSLQTKELKPREPLQHGHRSVALRRMGALL